MGQILDILPVSALISLGSSLPEKKQKGKKQNETKLHGKKKIKQNTG
jgi:hypothetical protein